MKVLHLLAGGAAGGAETYFTETVCALAEAGLRQHVVLRHDPGRRARLQDSGVTTSVAPYGHWLDFATPRAIRRATAAFQPDIVQAWMGRAASVLPPQGAPAIGWFGGYYDLKRYRNADWFVGCTYDIARHIAGEGVPAAQVHTIHTFADLDDAPAVPRADFTTPDGVPLLLFLGRLHRKKGIDIALRALADLPECWLWIAGEGPLRGELQALVQRLGVAARTRFLGWRTDRGALLRAADMLVVPSRYEPFGTIMVEAWGTDTPLIAAAAAGPSAYVEDGTNGLLVPIDDASALALAIRRVLAEPRLAETLVAGGRATFEARFTRGRIVQDWLDYYEFVAAGGRRRHRRRAVPPPFYLPE